VAVTPTGIYSLLLEDLRDLLAACASWRTWTDAADEAAAKALVFPVAAEREAADVYAVVGHGDDAEFESALEGRGSLSLRFSAAIPEAYEDDVAEAEVWFTNHVGAVLADLLALAGTGGHLFVRYVRAAHAPRAPSRDETGTPRFRQDWFVYWGLEGGRA